MHTACMKKRKLDDESTREKVKEERCEKNTTNKYNRFVDVRENKNTRSVAFFACIFS